MPEAITWAEAVATDTAATGHALSNPERSVAGRVDVRFPERIRL